MLPFTVEEYKGRLAKTKKAMEENGIETLFVSDPANMYWLTGYDAMSYYEPQGLLVDLTEDMPYWLGRFMDQEGARFTTYLTDDHIHAYPDKQLWNPAESHVMDFIADFIKGKGWDKKNIGVEMDAYFYTARWHERLTRALPDAAFHDATNMVSYLRAVKSTKELEYMNIAARIIERVMANAIDRIGPGVPEKEVGAGILYDQVMGTEEYGGDLTAIPPITPSGDRTATAHVSWQTEGCYENNQLVYMELAGVYKRYHAPMSRTIYIGQPPEEIVERSKICIEGINAAIEATKPGVTCEEVERVWATTIGKYGLEKESRMAYAVGCAYTPCWPERTIYFKPGEKTVIEEDMTFHMMPGVWKDGFGVAFTETLHVTSHGAETLTRFPRKLFVK